VKRGPKIIAPRLLSGDRRETIGHGLPPHIKEGIRDIARKENKSVSWVLETIIIEYFGFSKPKYIERKTDNAIKIQPQARVIPHRPRARRAS
jgi:hypothetical protein